MNVIEIQPNDLQVRVVHERTARYYVNWIVLEDQRLKVLTVSEGPLVDGLNFAHVRPKFYEAWELPADDRRDGSSDLIVLKMNKI